MPVRSATTSPVRSQPNTALQPNARWKASPSLDQAARGQAYIKKGQVGEPVRQVQNLLNAAGARLDTDGYLGDQTDQALRRFQAQHGLAVDGVVGPDTMRALQGGGSVEGRPETQHRNDSQATVGRTGTLAGTADRAPSLGAETATARTGLHGLLSGGGQLSRSDIDWSSPAVRPPDGRITKPSAQAFAAAVKAYDHAKEKGEVRNHKMTLIDFSRPSTESRMWVIDMDSKKLLAQHRVAHGSGSGDPRDARMASRFSNTSGSHKSAIGTYITAETYNGHHGNSLRLEGKEGGYNSNARSRAIVMHSASYASDSFVRQHGYLGRSQGCPAMDPAVAQQVIGMVKNGSAMLIYSGDAGYAAHSTYMND